MSSEKRATADRLTAFQFVLMATRDVLTGIRHARSGPNVRRSRLLDVAIRCVPLVDKPYRDARLDAMNLFWRAYAWEQGRQSNVAEFNAQQDQAKRQRSEEAGNQRPAAWRQRMENMRPLLAYLQPHKKELRSSAVLAGLATVSAAVDPFLWRATFTAVFAGGAWPLPLAFLGANLVLGMRLRQRVMRTVADIGNKVTTRISDDLLRAAQAKPKSWFAEESASQVEARLLNDVPALRRTCSDLLPRMILNGFAVAATSVAMFVMSPGLALAMAGPLAVVAFVGVRAARQNRALDTMEEQSWGRVMTIVRERSSLRGLLTSRHLDRDEAARGELGSELSAHNRTTSQSLRLRQRVESTVERVYVGGMLSVLGLTASVFSGQVSPATLVAFSSLSARMFVPVTSLPVDSLDLHNTAAAAQRVLSVLTTHNEQADEGRSAPSVGRDGIEFRSVQFAYPGNGPVIGDLNLSVAPQTYLAVVGASGAGKTTILDLLTDNLQPTGGSVTVGGVSVSDIDKGSLRDLISVIDQNPFFLSRSVVDNMREARPDATLRDIANVCRRVGMHDMLASLPHAYDTSMGPEGARFSGGQRQRLAIARALLRDAPIIVADEPTASLDAASRASVGALLAEIATDRTVMVVTHDMQLARQADVVAVLAGGRVAEYGPPNELLARNAEFARSCRLAASPVDTHEPGPLSTPGGLGRSL